MSHNISQAEISDVCNRAMALGLRWAKAGKPWYAETYSYVQRELGFELALEYGRAVQDAVSRHLSFTK